VLWGVGEHQGIGFEELVPTAIALVLQGLSIEERL
jgi:hypothetical protein